MKNEEIEKAILYFVIFDKEECNLFEKDFTVDIHKKIVKAINQLKAEKEDITMLTIHSKVNNSKVNILEYLSDLGRYVWDMKFDTAYELLKRYSKKRDVFELAKEMQLEVINADEIDTFIENSINKLQKIELQTEKDTSFTEQVTTTLQEIEKRIVNKDTDTSFYTGFLDLDKLTNGLHHSELTIVGARPAVGKTTFALQITGNILKKGKSVAFVSLEMSEEQIISKIISRIAKVNSERIKSGNLLEEEIAKIATATTVINDYSLTILTKCKTIQQIEVAAKRLKNRDKLDLLVIDYLQLIRNTGNFTNREQQVADISRTLKLMSLDLKIPVIALCQVNRNAAKAVPTMSDLRESGSIEQDADNIILLYEENEGSNIVSVDLQKQRAGSTGKIKLKFNRNHSEFVNLVSRSQGI